MQRSLTPAASALLLLLLAGAATPAAAAPARVGEPAPPFTAYTYDGRKITLAELRGKVVVLNYWATWCGPCRVEMPVLDGYLRRHPGAEVQVLAVSTEGSLPRSKLRPLAEVLSFPLVATLTGKGYGKVGNAVPTNYIIDRAGVLREAKAGAFTEAGFEARMEKYLAEPAG